MNQTFVVLNEKQSGEELSKLWFQWLRFIQIFQKKNQTGTKMLQIKDIKSSLRCVSTKMCFSFRYFFLLLHIHEFYQCVQQFKKRSILPLISSLSFTRLQFVDQNVPNNLKYIDNYRETKDFHHPASNWFDKKLHNNWNWHVIQALMLQNVSNFC